MHKVIAVHNYDYVNGGRQRREDFDDGGKVIRPWHQEGDTWVLGEGKVPRVLYNLSAIRMAPADVVVYFVEGEKCVEALRDKGLLATTTPFGADSFDRAAASARTELRGRRVIVCEDNDAPGRKYGHSVVETLITIVSDLRVVRFGGHPEKYDVADFLLDHDVSELEALWIDQVSLAKIPPLSRDITTFLGRDEGDDENDADDWLIRGLVPAGAPCIIVGKPKTQKTLIGLHQCITISAGLPSWLGTFDARRGRVLVLAYEDPTKETRKRLWRLARGLGLDPRDLTGWLRIADFSEPFHFDDEKEMGHMVRAIEDWQPQLLFIDSLSRVHRSEEKSKEGMQPVTEAMLVWAAKYQLTTTAIHHSTKVEGNSPIECVRGTGDLGAVARHVVRIRAKISKAGPRMIDTEGTLAYQPDPFQLVVSDGVTVAGKPTIRLDLAGQVGDELVGSMKVRLEMERRVQVELAAGPLSTYALRNKLSGMDGYGNATLDSVLGKMKRDGLIGRIGGEGPWRLNLDSLPTS